MHHAPNQYKSLCLMCYHLISSTRSRCWILPEQNNLTIDAPGRGLSRSDLFLCFRWELPLTSATNRRGCGRAWGSSSASSTSSLTGLGTYACRSPSQPNGRRSSHSRSELSPPLLAEPGLEPRLNVTLTTQNIHPHYSEYPLL